MKHLFHSAVTRRCTWQKAAGGFSSVKWRTKTSKSSQGRYYGGETKEKYLQYESAIPGHGSKFDTKVTVTNQNISYRELWQIQKKFGEAYKKKIALP